MDGGINTFSYVENNPFIRYDVKDQLFAIFVPLAECFFHPLCSFGLLSTISIIGSSFDSVNIDFRDSSNNDDTCKLIGGVNGFFPSEYPGFLRVSYDCNTFKSWPIIRYIPGIVKSQVPLKAPCAPGFYLEQMPVDLKFGVNNWRICRFKS